MKKLRESGYITLTQQGLSITEKMYERHQLLSNFLMDLGVSKEIALEDACRIEHVVSEESFDKIKEFVKWYNNQKPFS